MMSLKEIALEVVKTKQIEIIPSDYEKIYFNWMENLHDWCISRQIWYGHQIPVWYKGEELKVQAESPGPEWTQDEDTLDTWFSSGMWTFSGLGWPNNLEDFNKFHPTSVLETGHDILFFWVARMILMTTYATKQIPFKKVYLHGLIRDRNGKKMSKSLGNGIDPLDMIAKYGTDALRLSLVIGNSAGRDLKIYEEKIESFRNFITKLWNGSRFTFMNLSKIEYVEEIDLEKVTALHDKWILTRLQEVIEKVTSQLDKYSISEAGTTIYEFLWDEFCDWYLEFSKESKNEQVLSYVLQNILILLHPFIPFVTENIWTNFTGTKNQLIAEKWPVSNPNYKFKESNDLNTIIRLIRHIRTEKATFGLATTKNLKITVLSQNKINSLQENQNLIFKLAKLKEIEFSTDLDLKINQASLTIIESDLKFYLHLDGQIDFKAEADKTSQEIQSTLKLITGFESRLSNESYVQNAPKEIVEETQNNLQESKNRLLELEKRLQVLNT
jgi:valyl-tRNA synthetase